MMASFVDGLIASLIVHCMVTPSLHLHYASSAGCRLDHAAGSLLVVVVYGIPERVGFSTKIDMLLLHCYYSTSAASLKGMHASDWTLQGKALMGIRSMQRRGEVRGEGNKEPPLH